jgi:hypothetical protein
MQIRKRMQYQNNTQQAQTAKWADGKVGWNAKKKTNGIPTQYATSTNCKVADGKVGWNAGTMNARQSKMKKWRTQMTTNKYNETEELLGFNTGWKDSCRATFHKYARTNEWFTEIQYKQHLELQHQQQVARVGPTNIAGSAPAGRRTESGSVYSTASLRACGFLCT